MKERIELLKYWLDAEMSVLHIYILVVIWLLTHGFVPHLIVGFLIFINFVYAIKRGSYVMNSDNKFLKVPKYVKKED